MPDSAAFASVTRELEASSDLDRLEARGTIRLALRSAGLDASTVTPHQMSVVIERVLPGELEGRGVPEPQAVCARLASALTQVPEDAPGETPDAVFQRLAGAR